MVNHYIYKVAELCCAYTLYVRTLSRHAMTFDGCKYLVSMRMCEIMRPTTFWKNEVFFNVDLFRFFPKELNHIEYETEPKDHFPNVLCLRILNLHTVFI